MLGINHGYGITASCAISKLTQSDIDYIKNRFGTIEYPKLPKIDCNLTENFFKERSRMCSTVTCSECPLHHPYDNCADIVVFHHDRAMEIVQKWSDEHPEGLVKTFADDFFEKFPNASKDENGVPCVGCPHHFGYCEYKCDHNCKECWGRPLSEVKK